MDEQLIREIVREEIAKAIKKAAATIITTAPYKHDIFGPTQLQAIRVDN